MMMLSNSVPYLKGYSNIFTHQSLFLLEFGNCRVEIQPCQKKWAGIYNDRHYNSACGEEREWNTFD